MVFLKIIVYYKNMFALSNIRPFLKLFYVEWRLRNRVHDRATSHLATRLVKRNGGWSLPRNDDMIASLFIMSLVDGQIVDICEISSANIGYFENYWNLTGWYVDSIM